MRSKCHVSMDLRVVVQPYSHAGNPLSPYGLICQLSVDTCMLSFTCFLPLLQPAVPSLFYNCLQLWRFAFRLAVSFHLQPCFALGLLKLEWSSLAVKAYIQQQQQSLKVWQPQRAARSKQPNTPSDGSKRNGF